MVPGVDNFIDQNIGLLNYIVQFPILCTASLRVGMAYIHSGLPDDEQTNNNCFLILKLYVRSCTVQCVAFFPEEENASKQALVKWVVAFTRSLQAQLQDNIDLRNELEGVLTDDELNMLMASNHK